MDSQNTAVVANPETTAKRKGRTWTPEQKAEAAAKRKQWHAIRQGKAVPKAAAVPAEAKAILAGRAIKTQAQAKASKSAAPKAALALPVWACETVVPGIGRVQFSTTNSLDAGSWRKV